MEAGKKEIIEYNAITHGTIWKALILYCLPLILGNFFQQLYNTADAIVVGRFVGKQALSAVGGSSAVWVNVFVGLFTGISSGATVIAAQFFGAQQREKLHTAVHTAIALSLFTGAVLTVLGFLLTPALCRMLDTPADVLGDTVLYLRIFFLGIVGNLLYNMGSGILRAVGDSRRPLLFLIISCAINIVLDIFFIVVLGLGVAGAAIATILCQFISACMVLYVLLGTEEPYRLSIGQIRFDQRMTERILSIGVPAAVQSLMYTASNLLVQQSINRFGTDYVAAWAAYGKVDMVFWMVNSSFGVALQTFVAQNYGAGLLARVRKTVRQCSAVMVLWTVPVSILIYIFGCYAFQLFTEDTEVLRIGVRMLRDMTPFYICYLGIEVFSAALRGMGDAMRPMLIDILGICVIRVLWLLFVVPAFPEIHTVILSFPITWILTSTAFLLYYLYYVRKRKIE